MGSTSWCGEAWTISIHGLCLISHGVNFCGFVHPCVVEGRPPKFINLVTAGHSSRFISSIHNGWSMEISGVEKLWHWGPAPFRVQRDLTPKNISQSYRENK